jgi:hypothetical protein
VIGVAVALGPLVGAVINSSFGWRWAFLVNVPIGIVLVALAVSVVEESRDPDAVRLDFAGMILFGGGLFCLVWVLIDGNVVCWLSQPILLKLAAVVSFTLFVAAECVQTRPMVEFSLFRRRTFLGASVPMLGFALSAQVMMTYLPLYLQNAFGLGAAAAGFGMLLFALPLFFCPRIAATPAMRVFGRVLLTLGLAIVALGNIATAALIAAHESYAVIAIGMLVTGCGAGLLNGETAKVSMSVIRPERGCMASGISGTLRFIGLVTGITGLGAVLASGTKAHFIRAVATSGLSGSVAGSAQVIVSRIISGDIAGALEHVAPAARAALIEVSRGSFAAGFTSVLIVAGGIAALGALLTVLLVGAVETGAARLPGGAASRLPGAD